GAHDRAELGMLKAELKVELS
ncbi:hypothetical protein A2U01_0065147, partial [Trifolium medium]|nr:hypothetical protein [Trifolium medium]